VGGGARTAHPGRLAGRADLGKRRVDPDASAPAGRGKQAIAGIILGVVGLVPTRIWVATPLFNVRL
jgi:hypothetical protein